MVSLKHDGVEGIYETDGPDPAISMELYWFCQSKTISVFCKSINLKMLDFHNVLNRSTMWQFCIFLFLRTNFLTSFLTGSESRYIINVNSVVT